MTVPTSDPVRVTPRPDAPAPTPEEETEVADARGELSPSQQVEQRVNRLLADTPAFVSQMQRQMNRGAR
jgi:hypothetical protein